MLRRYVLTPQRPPPSSAPLPGSSAGAYTDPHIVTFDGFHYDCQANGEFVLVSAGRLQVQGRFVGPSTSGTVMMAVATADDGAVPVSIAAEPGPGSIVLNGSPVSMYLGGEATPVQSTACFVLAIDESSIDLEFMSGMKLSFSPRQSSVFGCYLEFLNIFLPNALTSDVPVLGLLGSPNGNAFDDWMTPGGELLEVPFDGGQRGIEAYEYCTTNWCIQNAADSLFHYSGNTSHATFSRCGDAYEPADLSSAPSTELVDLCGDNEPCLIDGLVTGDEEEARAALVAGAIVDSARVNSSLLSFSPTAIAQGVATNVLVTMDSTGVTQVVNRYNLYRVGGGGNEIEPTIATLEDDGLATSSDAVAGDGIYTNIIALQSDAVGEEFSFVVHPIIGGAEDRTTAASFTLLRAVSFYTRVSGAVEVTNAPESSFSVSTLDNIELLIQYSWPTDQRDLDTSTTFLSGNVGFECNPITEYLNFLGDITDSGGTETIAAAIGEAFNDGAWSGSTTVGLNAGWYSFAGGSGPATIRIVLRDTATQSELPQTQPSKAIEPGAQSDCAATPVREISIVDGGSSFLFVLSKGLELERQSWSWCKFKGCGSHLEPALEHVAHQGVSAYKSCPRRCWGLNRSLHCTRTQPLYRYVTDWGVQVLLMIALISEK